MAKASSRTNSSGDTARFVFSSAAIKISASTPGKIAVAAVRRDGRLPQAAILPTMAW